MRCSIAAQILLCMRLSVSVLETTATPSPGELLLECKEVVTMEFVPAKRAVGGLAAGSTKPVITRPGRRPASLCWLFSQSSARTLPRFILQPDAQCSYWSALYKRSKTIEGHNKHHVYRAGRRRVRYVAPIATYSAKRFLVTPL